MPSKAPKDDGTEEQEATASLAASKEISSVDVAVVAALSDVDGIFTFKEQR